jgi:hypothetical protein
VYPAIVRTTLLQRQVFPETDLARCDQGRLDVCAPSLGLSLGMRWIWDGSMNHLVSTCRQHVISTIVFLFSHVKTGWFINQKEALNSGPNWWYLMIIHKLKKKLLVYYWCVIQSSCSCMPRCFPLSPSGFLIRTWICVTDLPLFIWHTSSRIIGRTCL